MPSSVSCLRSSTACLFASPIACLWSASQVSYSPGVTTRTRAVMSAWLRPHSSAHWPLYSSPARGRLEPRVVAVAGDGVELAAELRDPPGVDDVGRLDVEHDGRVRRHDHLLVGVGQAERVGLAARAVRVAPDVLAAGHADRSASCRSAASARSIEAVSTPSASWRPFAPLFGGSWIEPSFANVTAASTTRISAAPTVQAISRRVLPWIWAATRPFLARNLIERVEQRTLDDHEHDDRDVEDDLVQRVDLVGVRRPTRFRGEEVGERAAGEDERAGRREQQGRDEAAAERGFRSQGGADSTHGAAECASPALERRRTLLQEGGDALDEVLRDRLLLLDRRLQLELLLQRARTPTR